MALRETHGPVQKVERAVKKTPIPHGPVHEFEKRVNETPTPHGPEHKFERKLKNTPKLGDPPSTYGVSVSTASPYQYNQMSSSTGRGPLKQDMDRVSIHPLWGPGPRQGGYGLSLDMPPLGAGAQTRRIWLELRYAPLWGPGPSQGGYDLSLDTPPLGAGAQTRRIWLEPRYAPWSSQGRPSKWPMPYWGIESYSGR